MIVALDIGGHHVAGALIDDERRSIVAESYRHRAVGRHAGKDELLDGWAGLIAELAAANPKLTLLPFLITAMSRALADFPMLNATFDDEAMVVTRHGSVHMGMATQTPNGLMVATIRDAQAKSVWQLASEIARLSDAARTGKATREELSGATFTISSLGPMGGITSTPVVNPPQVAIVAVNKIEDKLVPIDGEIEVRKRMNLSLSCDHRVVDGWDAASFLQAMKPLIENPLRLLS